MHTAPQMRSRPLIGSLLLLPLLGCNDNTPSYPAIIIYENPQSPSGVGNTGNVGSGNTGNTSSYGGSGNSSGGGSNGGGSSTGLYGHCEQPWSEPVPVGKVECDMDALTDGGVLTGDVSADRTLTSGHSYLIKGGVRVMPGVTLTIEPCVKLIGENSDAILAVLSGGVGDPVNNCFYSGGEPAPGGKLIAVGEPMAPIVFTSAKPKGQRKPGDWGGVILMGNAQNNLALSEDGVSGVQVPIEGLLRNECHGWPTDKFNDESSGELKYVRIEYASKQLVKDSETNGLSLGSLGRGTKLHYIMVSNSGDDCFEWFGGAANADHLIALNCDDDMFDADNGFSGHVQFLFGRQYFTTTEVDSRGFEIDGAPNQVYQPRTSAQFSNFTLCGGGLKDTSVFRDGAVMRNLAENVKLLNGFITGFAGSGVYVMKNDSEGARMNFVDVFGNTKGLMAGADVSNGKDGAAQDWFFNQDGDTTADPDRFCNCWADPPVAVPGTPSKGETPTGFDDESAQYMGAFKDPSADSNWMRGAWVDWSAQ